MQGEMKYVNVQQQQQYTALWFCLFCFCGFYTIVHQLLVCVYLLYFIHVYIAAYLYIYKKVL